MSLIIIPFNVPWVWSTDYLNQTAIELGNRGNIVICYLYAEAANIKSVLSGKSDPFLIKRFNKNIFVYKPFEFIPLRRFSLISNINSTINLILLRIITETVNLFYNCKEKIFWIFDPNLYWIYKFFGKNYYLLYDCVDFFAIGTAAEVKKTNKNEKLLCHDANLVVANSKVLKAHLIPYRKDVGLVPQGFRLNGFKVNNKKYINLDLKSPVIGFVGGINDRLDLSILNPLIENNPQWRFVFWGPVQMREKIKKDYWENLQKLLNSKNVTTGSSSDKEEIPGLISQFDIGIIPYDISQDFNKYCYPMKLFEFFFMGKPVVSTDILELRRFSNLVQIGNNYNEWQTILNSLTSHKWSKKSILMELNAAKENTWEEKIKQILSKKNEKKLL